MTGEGSAQREAARERSRRQARLAEVFGDVLPESTSDDRDDGGRREGSGDAWLRAQVPPHHGS